VIVSLSAPLLARHPANPILSAADWPYQVHSVFNPGAVTLATGETLLLARVEDRTSYSHLTTARSADGVSGWRIDPAPTLQPDPRHPEEEWGIEDPRIVWLQEMGRYAITYTAYSRRGPLVSLALTDDFVTFERSGPALPPENKDAALFPERIGGRWALIHRPVSSVPGERAEIWLSFSPDLKHWGDHVLLLGGGRPGSWDGERVGLSPPPVPTADGWLVVYHGVRRTGAGPIYRLGLALLDREDPRVVLGRTDEWVFGPSEPYELIGDTPNVVFPCGAVADAGSDELRLYYGAADACIALATARLSTVLDYIRHIRERGSADRR
jgi:predicted GH43/DUF377 family glycosyl hydrolase